MRSMRRAPVLFLSLAAAALAVQLSAREAEARAQEGPPTPPAPPVATPPGPPPALDPSTPKAPAEPTTPPATNAEPSPPPPAPGATETLPPPSPADATTGGAATEETTTAAPVLRDEGIRLGADLSYQRAIDGSPDRFNQGSPSNIPLAIDFSVRTSARFLIGIHAQLGLASRDDCISRDSCRARSYAVGAHFETPLSKGTSLIPWLRYGLTYELLYQGGLAADPTGYIYKSAVDFMDLRLGVDFVVSRGTGGRTVRLGPYIGLTAGVLVQATGIAHANGPGQPGSSLERSSGGAHFWLTPIGFRTTFDL